MSISIYHYITIYTPNVHTWYSRKSGLDMNVVLGGWSYLARIAQACLAGRSYAIGWLWWISALWDAAGPRPGLVVHWKLSKGPVQGVGQFGGTHADGSKRSAWVESDKERVGRLGATCTCWCLGRLNSPMWSFLSGGVFLKIGSSAGCTFWIRKLRLERWPLLKGLPQNHWQT